MYKEVGSVIIELQKNPLMRVFLKRVLELIQVGS